MISFSDVPQCIKSQIQEMDVNSKFQQELKEALTERFPVFNPHGDEKKFEVELQEFVKQFTASKLEVLNQLFLDKQYYVYFS